MTWRWWRWELHWQILLFLVLGAAWGLVIPASGGLALTAAELSGDLFLSAMKMLIVPLIGSSLIGAAAGMAQREGFARLGLKTMAWYMGTGLIAVTIGMVLVNLIQPGIGVGVDLQATAELQAASETVSARAEGRSGADLLNVLRMLVPENVIGAASDNGAMLSLISFALLFGFFVGRLPEEIRATQQRFWDGIFHAMLGVTHFVLRFAPYGVAGLIAVTVHDAVVKDALGAQAVQLAKFTGTVVLALSIHAMVVMPILLHMVGVRPMAHVKAVGPALLTAFSTASSSATLPYTMDCVRERDGVSEGTTSFVLPLGATVNMDGTALYECVVVIFVAQQVGMDLTLFDQMLILFTALVSSVGVAGVPSASLVAIILIMQQAGMGEHLDKLGLVLVVDRVLDMLRTVVNVFSDTCCAVAVAKTEGEVLPVDR